MNVLILAGYRQDDAALGLEVQENGLPLIDVQIEALTQMGLSPVVVLSGPNADEVLRKSKRLQTCELIFDTHGTESNLLTTLRAGIHGVEHTCFALPVEITCPPKTAWVALRRAYQTSGFSTKIALIQLTTIGGAPWHLGFPLFVTRLGRHLLLNEDEIQSLTDPKLKYQHCIFDPAEGLAVPASSL